MLKGQCKCFLSARTADRRHGRSATSVCFALLGPSVSYDARKIKFAAVADYTLSDSSPAQPSHQPYGIGFDLGKVPDRYHR